MGTFGYGPFENDDAMDWLDAKIRPVVAKALLSKRGDIKETEAALGVVVALRLGFEDEELTAALERVAEADEEMGGWRDPKKRRAALLALEKKLFEGRRARYR